ncbi:hypothetical protein SAMN05428953_102170 [Mesorhizobium muleiense]|jgi:hypothetical protein|uniref:Uncharacterized protein n=2 Tax=Mesorhizobium muleiense TaxID=1004279 RepID=A0A1G8L819_9HYPH|nr:hypothetical protein SAMN05428953_102170 [Mesorhizobium muleiense]
MGNGEGTPKRPHFRACTAPFDGLGWTFQKPEMAVHMQTVTIWRHAPVAAFVAAVALATINPAPGFAQAQALVTGEAADGTAAASVEVTGANRNDGILTVTLRIVSLPDSKGDIPFYPNAEKGYEAVYVVAGDKKYFALKDAEGKPLIPERAYFAAHGAGKRYLWAGKFTAPPTDVKAFSLVLPFSSPLDEIPITDR